MKSPRYAGICALVFTNDQLRIKGAHALTDEEERILLTTLEPIVRSLPTPESGDLGTFPAGRPQHLELSEDWRSALGRREAELDPGPQKRLDEYRFDVEEYLQSEIESALPNLCSTPWRHPTVF